LVRTEHVFVEDVHRDLDEGRVGYPTVRCKEGEKVLSLVQEKRRGKEADEDSRAIMTSLDFSDLVRLDLVHSDFVRLGVVLDRDLSRH
jgi:hypothetical protein